MQPKVRKKSWAVRINRGGGYAVFAGPSVERSAKFIAEGVWDAEFSASGLLKAGFRCGTGAIFNDDHIVLVAPSHSIGQVYCFVSQDEVVIGNSIHLIISLRPDAMFVGDIQSVWGATQRVMDGIADYRRVLYETPSGKMTRYAFGGAKIYTQDLSISEVTIGNEHSFSGYEGYKSHLYGTVQRLIDCGVSPKRVKKYGELVTTSSSGYDSAACSAVAKHFGASIALTMSTGRGGARDTGLPVAEALGLKCYEFERFSSGLERRRDGSELDWLDADKVPSEDWEFLASVNSPGDMFFTSFEPYLENALLLTGFHGDKVWDMKSSGGPLLVRGDHSGSGLDEFSSRVDFINVPVPFIGAVQSDEIARINVSEEMKEFRVAGNYDRPIPRRLVEEAGVPRSAFGQKKTASEILLAWSDAKSARRVSFDRLVQEYTDLKKYYCVDIKSS